MVKLEVIEQLKKQASSYASTKSKEVEEWRWIYENKFAELIVRECAKVCDELQKWPSTEPRHCASDIRIHFGVEE